MEEVGEVIFLLIFFGVPIYVFRRVLTPVVTVLGLIGGVGALMVWMNENPAAAEGLKEGVFTLAECLLAVVILRPIVYRVAAIVDRHLFAFIDRLSRRRPGDD
jgi:hypothetical protein